MVVAVIVAGSSDISTATLVVVMGWTEWGMVTMVGLHDALPEET